MMNNRAWPLRIAAGIWSGLDWFRKLLHLTLMIIVFVPLLIIALGDRAVIPSGAALLIAPRGAIVDQLSGDPVERAIAAVRGTPIQETLLRDIVDALRAARDDSRIKAVVLDLDGMGGAGLSKLQELAKEIAQFKESGKKVIAVGDAFTRDQYYLAAQADRIYMHPMGLVLIDGYSRFLPYYKSLLDKLYIDYHVWTVGEYKSFVEPIKRDDMSPADQEASRAFLSALWNAYQQDVTTARKLARPALQRYADEIAPLLADANGDTAKLALDYGLVDELATRDVVRQHIRELLGEKGAAEHDDKYTAVGLQDYVRSLRAGASPPSGNKVAVVVAAGEILDGSQPPGSIGGDSLSNLIRRVRADDDVKALVLRVDSGGGSAFASDVILREIEAFRESKRPVVVSMGSVAASGGYWISMAANEIWASPTTLTGSIGVGATIPTVPRTLAALGIHVDGIGTTDLSGAFETTRPLGENVESVIKHSIEFTYSQFIGKVAQYRNRPVAEIDAVAQGRVWVGTDALDRGLVDRLGGLSDSIESAAELAGLEAGSYSVDYEEPELTFAERMALTLASKATGPLAAALASVPHWQGRVTQVVETALEPLAFVQRLNDPRGIYAYCFCDTH
jgi:protease IV